MDMSRSGGTNPHWLLVDILTVIKRGVGYAQKVIIVEELAVYDFYSVHKKFKDYSK